MIALKGFKKSIPFYLKTKFQMKKQREENNRFMISMSNKKRILKSKREGCYFP